MAVFYAKSLGFGYIWDDPTNVTLDFSGANGWIVKHFRPLYYYSFALSNFFFEGPLFHHLVNYALMLWGVFLACKVAERYAVPLGPLVVLGIFLHPTFVYPTTWISQRNDFLLIDFLFLTLLHLDRARGFVYLLLSDLSKMPFVFQNLWYAFRQWRSGGNRLLAAASLLVLPPIILNGYLFYAGYSVEATSALAYLDIGGFQGFVAAWLARLAKVAEAWFLTLAPFPGYFKVGPLALSAAVAALYLILWGVVFRRILLDGQYRRGPYDLLVIGVLMSMPFVFNSDMRILGPAIPFFFFGIFSLAKSCRAVTIVLTAIVTLNAAGSVLNYNLSNSGISSPTVDADYQQCGTYEMQFPMERWRCDRSHIAREIVDRMNAIID